MEFNKGDVVQLKSGGPLMTVTGVVGKDAQLNMAHIAGYEQGDVAVEYFVREKLEKQVFKPSSLNIIPDNE